MYNGTMKSENILKEVAEKTGVKKMDLSRMFGISPAAVSKSFNANNPGLKVVARYLKVMGYTLYAVPSSLHIEAISDEAIKIEPEERKEKE